MRKAIALSVLLIVSAALAAAEPVRPTPAGPALTPAAAPPAGVGPDGKAPASLPDPEAAPGPERFASLPGANAVGSQYNFYQSPPGYTPIAGGTVHGTSSLDDESFNAIELGFTFWYDGVAYTQVSLQNNGFLAMGGTVSSSYTPLSSGPSDDVIAALGRDLQGNGTTSELMSLTQGAAPNRVFIAQWKDYKRYGSAYAGDAFNFQIRLHETSNLIQVVYGAFTVVAATPAATVQVGLRGAGTGDFNNLMTDATHLWAGPLPGTANTDAMALTDGVYPLNGLTYNWARAVGLFLDPATLSAQTCKGYEVTYSFTLTNLTGTTAAFGLTYGSDWPYTGPAVTPTLASEEAWGFPVTVHVPWSATLGDQKTLTVSVSDGAYSDSATAATTAGLLQGWQDYTNNPRPTRFASLVYHGGKLYKIGGYDGAARAYLDIYDIATDSWSTGTDMPAALYWTDCVAIGDFIYCAGGYSTAGQSTLYRYDIAGNTWTTLAAMSASRYDYAGAAVNGKYYVIGGYGTGYVSTIWEYDPATNTWNYSLPNMVTARRYHNVGVIGGLIYVAGGYNGAGLASVEVFNPTTGSWGAGPAMPSPWTSAGDAVLHDRYLIVAGGYSSLSTASIFAWMLDTVTGEWSAAPNLAHTLYAAEAAGDGNEVWLVGGRLYEGGVWSYSPYTTRLVECATACLPVTALDFTWTPLVSGAGESVAFTGTAGGTPPITWLLEFGDGNSASVPVANHSYAGPGLYTAVLSASNCDDPTPLVAYHSVRVVPPVGDLTVSKADIPDDGQVDDALLQWTSVPGVSGYEVQAAASPEGPFAALPNGTGVSGPPFFHMDALTDGTDVFYTVLIAGN